MALISLLDLQGGGDILITLQLAAMSGSGLCLPIKSQYILGFDRYCCGGGEKRGHIILFKECYFRMSNRSGRSDRYD